MNIYHKLIDQELHLIRHVIPLETSMGVYSTFTLFAKSSLMRYCDLVVDPHPRSNNLKGVFS